MSTLLLFMLLKEASYKTIHETLTLHEAMKYENRNRVELIHEEVTNSLIEFCYKGEKYNYCRELEK